MVLAREAPSFVGVVVVAAAPAPGSPGERIDVDARKAPRSRASK